VVIRFSGDSGDGMQLTGTLFSDTAALFGNDLSTFPDYPAEIRAPQGTVGGVSGFQVHLGHSKINTPGDFSDVLVAMNPAAIKANAKWIKPGGTIIYDEGNFTEKNIEKAGYKKDPISEEKLESYNIIAAPISSMVKEALKTLVLIRNLCLGQKICLHWEWSTGSLIVSSSIQKITLKRNSGINQVWPRQIKLP